MAGVGTKQRRAAPAWAACAVLAIASAASSLLPARPGSAEEGGTPEVEAPPGGVVRWSGAGIESCGNGERSWAPIGGACLYPVDLLTAEETTLEVRRRCAGAEETALIVVGRYPYPVQTLTVPDRQVHLSKRDRERVRREAERVAPLWEREGPAGYSLPLGPPLSHLPPGGRFGARRFFNGESRSPHAGVDYAASTGTPVHAVAPGVVALAEDHFFSGQSVFVDHGGGLVTMYFHLSKTAVRAGDTVAAGTRIGSVGATGRATGPHLHFGVRLHGARVNPELLLGAPEAVAAIPEAPASGCR